MFLELFHVSSDEHLTKFDEIAMIFVVDFDRSPGVRSSSYLTTIGGGDDRIGSDDGKGNLFLQNMRRVNSCSDAMARTPRVGEKEDER